VNLHHIASNAVSAVNPFVTAAIQASSGYTTSGDGSRVPSYAPAAMIPVQIQALQYQDILQLNGLNIQGTRRAMYINGDWEGLIRADKKGGDIITLPDGTVWLVALVLEHWPDWVKLAVTLQTVVDLVLDDNGSIVLDENGAPVTSG
jgi:hypothetical protein